MTEPVPERPSLLDRASSVAYFDKRLALTLGGVTIDHPIVEGGVQVEPIEGMPYVKLTVSFVVGSVQMGMPSHD